MSRLDLSPEVEEELIRVARESPDVEACGAIAGGRCHQLENIDPGPASFGIRGSDLTALAARHGGLEAVWHTHPSGWPLPTARDRAYHPWPLPLVIATREAVNVYYGDDTEDA